VPAGSYAANAIQVSQTDAWGHVSLTTGKLTSALVTQTGLSRVTVSLTDNLPSTANLSTNAVVYTLAFSEAVTGLDASDFTVMNGSVGAISGGGTSWSVSVIPAAGVANGAISLMVKAGAVSTLNGGYNTSGVNSSQLVDTVAPVAPLLVPGTAVRYVQTPQLTLQTSLGAVLIELNPEKAPVTVATVLANANSGFYDSTLFHRVVPGVAVQAGALSGTLAYKAPTYSTIPLESNNSLTHQVGSVAMLQASSTSSDGAQFFVDVAANPAFNYASAAAPGYAVFGQVLSGMGVINSMAQLPLSTNGVPLSPVTLTTLQQSQAGSAITRVGSFTLSALTSSTAWSYSLDAGGNWINGSGSNLALPDGSYAANAIQVRQVDSADNLSPVGKFSSALVVDSIAPTVSSFNPLDEATGVPTASNLALTFSETIDLGTGNITLKTAAGAVVESFDATSSTRLSLSGRTLSIDPTLALAPSTGYTLTLDAGTLKDLAGNPFAGSNSYNFNTAVAPNVLAYTWKAHTLLSDVSVSNGPLSHVTAGNGAINFEFPVAASQTLTASRAVPSAEASLTNGAVNLQDAIAILKMIVGLDVNGAGKPLSPYQALAADYDGNGAVQLTDAIGVLKHVVGLTAPQPSWHFVNELDTTVPGKANLNPGLPQTSISANTSGSSPVHVGLVGYLSGDVDGSFAGAAGALDLDALQQNYFASLSAASGLNMAQFGVYGA
jgi:peptidyl-prolyl cis-trans isomerase A (cyclophilin A)